MPLRILHTADIHLRELNDERWQALKQIINLGKEKKIDILVISGDLFDKDITGEKLRNEIRGLFSKTPFEIVLLPGNHDAQSYRPGLHFGEKCKIINDIDDAPFQYKDINLFGLPFQNQSQEQILQRLRFLSQKTNPDKFNILLYHGELLDLFFQRDDFGSEGENRYMPSYLFYFKNLGFDYVLAGHFHTKFQDLQFGDNQFFVYPGSPISITKREIGVRGVNLFDLGSQPNFQKLSTPYFKKIEIKLNPFQNEFSIPQKTIKQALKNLDPQAKLLLSIQGFVNCSKLKTTEKNLIKEIKEELSKFPIDDLEFQIKDISFVLEDDLFQQFNAKLSCKNFDEKQKQEIRNLVIEAIIETNFSNI